MPRPRLPLNVLERAVLHQQLTQLAHVDPRFVRSIAGCVDSVFVRLLKAGQVVSLDAPVYRVMKGRH